MRNSSAQSAVRTSNPLTSSPLPKRPRSRSTIPYDSQFRFESLLRCKRSCSALALLQLPRLARVAPTHEKRCGPNNLVERRKAASIYRRLPFLLCADFRTSPHDVEALIAVKQGADLLHDSAIHFDLGV